MRRFGVVVVAVLMAFGGVALVPAVTAGAAVEADGSDVSVVRHEGADRYATSLDVAEAVAADAGGSLEWAVVVSGERWTDAVVAAPVAGVLGAPVLMTPPGELRADALRFLRRVGVSQALVVGPATGGGGHGPGRGVGAGVLEALRAAGISVERVAGADRYRTAVEVAERVTPGAMGDLGTTAVIANGEKFADALVAGPFAARGEHPVLLTPPGELHADVAAYLRDSGIEHVVLMGGTTALTGVVERAVDALDIKASRMDGRTRYSTAVKAAKLVQGRYSARARTRCFANDTIGVARARVPYDSFSAAPLLGRLCAPLLLADPDRIPPDTAAYIDAARQQHNVVGLRVLGGDDAVSKAAINTYLTGDDGESATPAGILPAGTCGGTMDDNPRQLVPNRAAIHPAWSPDCSRLAYVLCASLCSLWTVNNDGTDARKLLDHKLENVDLGYPAWSPDGTRIAYSRSYPDEDWNTLAHIWTINVDGSHNKQLTTGHVRDVAPTWSPDGKRIAFQRRTGDDFDRDPNRDPDPDQYIVVMTSHGNKPKALNTGGRWEYSPVWSPDGTRLAYVEEYMGLSSLTVSDTDGKNARHIYRDVTPENGLSWSPDGTRIAFGREDGSIATINSDGTDETIILEGSLQGSLSGSTPGWSPDGQLLAFVGQEHGDDYHVGPSHIYVVGAGGHQLPPPADCRPRGGLNTTTTGFPLPDWAPAATGTLRVAVLFMDFPDAQAAHTTQEEAALGLPWAEDYLETASYGRLDVEFVALHHWLRAELESAEYRVFERTLSPSAMRHAVALAGDDVNFSGFDIVMTVFPSNYFGGGIFSHDAGDRHGNVDLGVNTFYLPREGEMELNEWGFTAAHEIAHNLGLDDMYLRTSGTVPTPPGDQTLYVFKLGLMNFESAFLAPPSATPGDLESVEMLAWSRWQLGWLREHQVECVTDGAATVTLGPISRPGGATAMAAVPISHREIIVIESRREFDIDGVFVYVVDTVSSSAPVRIAGDSSDGFVDYVPLLRAGESVTVLGYTIAVTADSGDTHTVSITRDN